MTRRSMKDLRGRAALVIGATGGIGGAIVERLADEGCRLALADLDFPAAARHPDAVLRHPVDLADEPSVERLAEAVGTALGSLDILVNAAGVAAIGPFDRQSSEEFDRLVSVDFHGVVYACRHCLPLLRRASARRGRAHIVTIGSVAGLVGYPLQTSYCAAKHAVRGFTRSLRSELAAADIGVTHLMPGAVATRLLERAHSRDGALRDRLGRLMLRLGMSPEILADRVVGAIRHDRAEQVVGLDAHLTVWLQRLAPGLAPRLLAAAFARYGPSPSAPSESAR